MAVSLRIVGIYYRQDNIPHTEGMTVKDVLDYAHNNPAPNTAKFGYQPGKLKIGVNSGKASVSSFFADYPGPVISKTSGIRRDKGMYYLPEDINSKPAFTAWQYYVFDKPLQKTSA